ncbi:hypothetical protein G7046_g10069 [Stylonectria norvegica]|nr:hypothetical protein G7046_g10069 [Stylonectria norvegica]
MASESSKSHDDESLIIVTPAEPNAETKTSSLEDTEAEKSEESKPASVSTKGKTAHRPSVTASGSTSTKPPGYILGMTGTNVTKDTGADETKEAKEETKAGEEESQEEKEEKKEKIIVGLLADTKDLYAKFDKNGDRSWSDKYPDDLEEAAENEETQKYAVIIRKKKPKEADSTKPLVIDSIIIQSPFLKRILHKVLEDYPGVVTDVSRLKIHAPFECFVHRWDRFEAAKNDPSHDELTREHIKILYKVLEDELGDIIQLRADYYKNKAVAFDHVWSLFPPGCTVYGSKHGKPVGLKFESGYYATTQCGKVYVLECKMIDWDGKIMGWVTHNQQISDFLGTVPFTELACYPLEHHNHPEAARSLLLERGRRFEELAGYCYKAYKGTAIWHVDSRRSRKETVQSRVVIDGENWEKLNPDHVIYLENIHASFEIISSSRASSDCDDDEDRDYYHSDESDDEENELEANSTRPALTEDQLIMTYPMVRGYALKNKRWMEFFIDDVTEVKFNEEAFGSLVLPDDQKELILAFAQSQVKYKDAFDDIISGKGKGIIMLLSGGPGIGKTLTAESVAEEMKVPLYIMSAGDLGTEADEVEDNLGKILEMVSNWNAVLLLDECDVFLEARSAHDIARNRIVSIFLRTLEYYEGILFLTTNRVKNMDPAFQSRIHMSLEYPPLDAVARERVWRGFLGRSVSLEAKVAGNAAHDVSEEEITALAALDLNGRQIKNLLKTSNLLACHKGERLAYSHLRTVLRVGGHSL